jgi:polyisoprenoid-binding protein YceI
MTASTTTLTGTWTVDVVHSDVSFKVRHMAVGKAKGTFALESATLTVPEAGLAEASVTAVIDAASVDTKQEQRDAHVKSPDFLHVEQHPTLNFVSTGVKDFDGDEFTLVGNLTIRGITKQVELATEFLGVTTDAYGFERVGFSATTSISRKEFGVSFNAAFGAGNSVVADKVEIALELEFTKNA